MPGTKEEIVAAVCTQLEEQIRRIEHASRENAAAATDSENRAEGEYDTRGLEASYLAGGQAHVVVELRHALEVLRTIPTSPWPGGMPIAVGAHVVLVSGPRTMHYLLAPSGGGMEIPVGTGHITIITPGSPVGRLLVGKAVGSTVEFPAGPLSKKWTLSSVG
jgi:transcription elongation GreA/GreB family factor